MTAEGWLFEWPMKERHYVAGGKLLCDGTEVLAGNIARLREIPSSMKPSCCAKCWTRAEKRKKGQEGVK